MVFPLACDRQRLSISFFSPSFSSFSLSVNFFLCRNGVFKTWGKKGPDTDEDPMFDSIDDNFGFCGLRSGPILLDNLMGERWLFGRIWFVLG